MLFWPLTASITSEVINDHVHVTFQRILNKFIKVNFSVGCMAVMLFQSLTTLNNIYKIASRVIYCRVLTTKSLKDKDSEECTLSLSTFSSQ